MMKETDDLLVFAEELPQGGNAAVKWKVLIVDDDEQVHKTTRLVLDEFVFDGRGLKFLSAYSAEEARIHLSRNQDIAVILLDVVMEENDSGLKLVQFIRDELKNRLVRIILKTGQPGYAPERKVISEYDINDYREKTELTDDRFVTAMVTALRSYRDMNALETGRKGLESIINSTGDIYDRQSLQEMAAGVLAQLSAALPVDRDAFFCKTEAFGDNDNMPIVAAIGAYGGKTGGRLQDVVPAALYNELLSASRTGRSAYLDGYCYACASSRLDSHGLAYFKCTREFNDLEREMAEHFCANYTKAFDNISVNNEIMNGLTEAVLLINDKNRVTYFNDTFSSFFPAFAGNSSDWIDLPAFAAYLKKTANESASGIINAVESGAAVEFTDELCIRGNRVRYFRVRVKPVFGMKKLIGRIVTMSEVTEYRRMVERLDEQNAQLTAMNDQMKKYASVVEELNTVSHNDKKRFFSDLCEVFSESLQHILKLSQKDTPSYLSGVVLYRNNLSEILSDGVRLIKELPRDESSGIRLLQDLKAWNERLDKLADKYREEMAGSSNLCGLDSLELKIVIMVSEGKSNREIAMALNFEEGTIKNKIGEIIRKISISSAVEKRCMLVSFAYEKGLIGQFKFI